MNGGNTVIIHLAPILRNALTAVNQYFLHSRILKDQGLEKLGEDELKESLGRMKHANRLTDRVVSLEGQPDLRELGTMLVGESVQEILENDLSMEMGARKALVAGIQVAETVGDSVTREILEHILRETEEHVDYLETELALLKTTGLEAYIRLQSS